MGFSGFWRGSFESTQKMMMGISSVRPKQDFYRNTETEITENILPKPKYRNEILPKYLVQNEQEISTFWSFSI